MLDVQHFTLALSPIDAYRLRVTTNTADFDSRELDPSVKPFWKPSEMHRLGLGSHRAVLYAIESGEIEAVRIGKRLLIPTMWIRRKMQLPDLPSSSVD